MHPCSYGHEQNLASDSAVKGSIRHLNLTAETAACFWRAPGPTANAPMLNVCGKRWAGMKTKDSDVKTQFMHHLKRHEQCFKKTGQEFWHVASCSCLFWSFTHARLISFRAAAPPARPRTSSRSRSRPPSTNTSARSTRKTPRSTSQHPKDAVQFQSAPDMEETSFFYSNRQLAYVRRVSVSSPSSQAGKLIPLGLSADHTLRRLVPD